MQNTRCMNYSDKYTKVSRSKSFPESLPAVHLSLETQFAAILLESVFQGTGVVGWLRVRFKRSRSSAPKRRLKR